MNKLNWLKEYYDSIPGLPPFDEADTELKEGIYQSWAFQMYCAGCAWDEFKQVIKDEVKKVLPKN